MLRSYIYKCFCVLIACICLQGLHAQKKSVIQKADSVLRLMTLDEKIGQLHQLSSDFAATGPIKDQGDKQDQIRKGMMGSMLNIYGASRTRQVQQMAMQSRLKIPILFGQDIIHGFRTIFPIPLGQAASWDLQAIEEAERIAAIEGSAQGIHWTFAPMVDVGRDPRWGRVMEGSGEDTYLGSMIAAARVRGFQGDDLSKPNTIMACAKHFAAYGAAVGGRDYNSVDMSLRQLHEVYLPPFKAALQAGVGTFMNSFNDLNGIPATGNAYLQRNILKGSWGFKGFVVSDWGSMGEMINHHYAADGKDAALKSILAGSDMDMESSVYIKYLKQLVQEGKVPVKYIDDAVRRILVKKFELGLFDDPYRYCNEAEEQRQWNNTAHLEAAKQMAMKSIVLLKNDSIQGQAILPISSTKKIALIGPLVQAVHDMKGFWSYTWPDDSTRISTLGKAIHAQYKNVTYAKGCNLNDKDSSGFEAARQAALAADVVVVYVGEAGDMSGEAKSRSSLRLPGVQEQLVLSLIQTGKPVVVLIGAGRPLVFPGIADRASAIVYTWWLGTMAGDAITNVLSGAYNPSGKLPMSFPRTEGQIPIYYNYFNTGRPAADEYSTNYVTAYTDLPNSPQYAFGYGLGYAPFNYSNLTVSSKKMKGNNSLQLSVTVSNTGKVAGRETVQLYIQDKVASVVRPVKELKGFKQIDLNAGESKTVTFTITPEQLKFFNNDLVYTWESGSFIFMVGGSSKDVLSTEVYWEK